MSQAAAFRDEPRIGRGFPLWILGGAGLRRPECEGTAQPLQPFAPRLPARHDPRQAAEQVPVGRVWRGGGRVVAGGLRALEQEIGIELGEREEVDHGRPFVIAFPDLEQGEQRPGRA